MSPPTIFNEAVQITASTPRAYHIEIGLPYQRSPEITIKLERHIEGGGGVPSTVHCGLLGGPYQLGRVIPRFDAQGQPIPGQSRSTDDLMAAVRDYVYHLAHEDEASADYQALMAQLNPPAAA